MAEKYDVVVIGGGISGGSGREQARPPRSHPPLPGHPAGSAPGAAPGGGAGAAMEPEPRGLPVRSGKERGDHPCGCVRDKSLPWFVLGARRGEAGGAAAGSAHRSGTGRDAGYGLRLEHPRGDGLWTRGF